MGKVTYTDPKVIDLLNSAVVPLLMASDAQPYAEQWRVKWTPMFFVMSEDQKPNHRNVGYLPPEEFIPWVLLGMAKTEFNRDRFAPALQHVERLLSEHPQSGSAPEAVYLGGVAGYKHSKSIEPLKDIYKRLQADYPASLWTKRAQPYSLLP